MTDDERNTIVEAAYERFQRMVLSTVSAVSLSGPMARVVARTLRQLRGQVQADPAHALENPREAAFTSSKPK